MASWSYFEGKTVDAALKKAGLELAVSADKLEYEIVSSGSSGIFGLVGAKNAKIRVVVPQSQIGSNKTRATLNDEERQEILSLVDESFAEHSGVGKEPFKEAVKDAGRKVVRESEEEVEPAEKEAAASRPAKEKKERVETTKYTEADFETGKQALSKIISHIAADATISVQIKSHQVLFNIEGENAAVLIGKHGQTLKAMQHILEKIVQKSNDEKVRVLVDVESYMEKRRASLKTLATRLAEKVKQTGKPTTINRMDAFERKIIHDTLRKDKNVKTKSAGGGEVRNIVIHPGKKKGRSKKEVEK